MSNSDDTSKDLLNADGTLSVRRVKTGGKKKGWKKNKEGSGLTNGLFGKEELYAIVPENTLPSDPETQNRFLSMCNIWIVALGAESIGPIDLEEIALYCRDRIFTDLQYKTFAVAKAMDTSMVKQLESINKQLEKRKENLAARHIDKNKRSSSEGNKTFLDLFQNFKENEQGFLDSVKQNLKLIEESKSNYTQLDDYMDAAVSNATNSQTKIGQE